MASLSFDLENTIHFPPLSMASLNFDLENTIHFPPLSTRYVHHPKLRNHHRRNREYDNDIETSSRINDLNDALLELIFARVTPWKYLANSKCVSKRWNSIISNPDFIRHLTHQHCPFTLLLRQGIVYGKCLITEHPHFQKHKLRLDFFPGDFNMYDERMINIVAHHNDVLVSYRYINCEEAEFYLVNPLTKQFIVVPITFATSVPSSMVGFAGGVKGVSTINANMNHEFRIVRIINEYQEFVVHIYSSETGQWKTYSFNNPHDLTFNDPKFGQAITFNNKVHWLKRSKILVLDPFKDDMVRPRILNLPSEIHDNSVLDACQNRLRLSQFERKRDDLDHPRIKVWEIEDSCEDENDLACNYEPKLRLVIDICLTRSILERDLSPIGRLFPKIYSYSGDGQVICCHPLDPQVVYFVYDDTLYRCNIVKQRCKVVAYCTSKWLQRIVFVHPLMS